MRPLHLAVELWRPGLDVDVPEVLSTSVPTWHSSRMPSYLGYRFPSEVISHAMWLYHRFSLSFRDVEDLLAERGINVTYETIRQRCRTFGLEYARRLRRRRCRQGDTWYLDELLVRYCQVEADGRF